MTRALIVEDEILVALDLENALEEIGVEVIGIAPDMASALELGASADFALVDINLRDGPTGPNIGRALAERGVRVMFLTANPATLGDGVDGTFGVLTKPFTDESIIVAVDYLARKNAPNPPPTNMRLFAAR